MNAFEENDKLFHSGNVTGNAYFSLFQNISIGHEVEQKFFGFMYWIDADSMQS